MSVDKERIIELVRIIQSEEIVPITVTREVKIGPTSGDGHSFKDSYDIEKVVETVGHRPRYKRSDKLRARNELQRIQDVQENEGLRKLCRQGIESLNEGSWREVNQVLLGFLIVILVIGGVGLIRHSANSTLPTDPEKENSHILSFHEFC